MANRCADDGGTALVIGEKQPRRGFSFFSPFLSFSPFYWSRGGSYRSGRLSG